VISAQEDRWYRPLFVRSEDEGRRCKRCRRVRHVRHFRGKSDLCRPCQDVSVYDARRAN